MRKLSLRNILVIWNVIWVVLIAMVFVSLSNLQTTQKNLVANVEYNTDIIKMQDRAINSNIVKVDEMTARMDNTEQKIGGFGGLEDEIYGLQMKVNDLEWDIYNLKIDVDNLEWDAYRLQSDVSKLKREVYNLQLEVQWIKFKL